MKRFMCPEHTYRLKTGSKAVLLSTEQCSICKWDKRPWTLKDFALELEDIACSLHISHENPNYDPFGFTYAPQIEDFIVNWLKGVNPKYRKSLLKRINGATDE